MIQTQRSKSGTKLSTTALPFLKLDELDHESGLAFFEEQTYTGIAVDSNTNEIVGLYILHPNNVGRCGHICNASYAVSSAHRGKQIGEFLVTDCIKRAPEFNFKILQFNAVVASNKEQPCIYTRNLDLSSLV